MTTVFDLIKNVRDFLITLPKDFKIALHPLDVVLNDLDKIEKFIQDILEEGDEK